MDNIERNRRKAEIINIIRELFKNNEPFFEMNTVDLECCYRCFADLISICGKRFQDYPQLCAIIENTFQEFKDDKTFLLTKINENFLMEKLNA